jgi:predicted porin
MRRSCSASSEFLLAALLSNVPCTSAMAQTSVTVEGVIDTFIGSMRSSGDVARTVKIDGSGMTTSWIGFKGSEDLGGGMQANFALAAYFRPDSGDSGRFPGDPMFSRAANVGLSGRFGAVSLGRAAAPTTLSVLRFNPFGNAPTFSPLALHLNIPLLNASRWGNSLAGDTGWSNQIRYSTPPVKDVTVNLHYQFGEAASDSKKNVGASLSYMGNPLSLTAFIHRVKVNNPLDAPDGIVKSASGLRASRQTAWFIGAGYDFKSVKLFATHDQTTHDIDLHDRTHSIGITVPSGKDEFMAAWAQTRREGTGIPDQRRDTMAVGYSHKPSKRTSLYLVVMHDRISTFDSGSSIGAGIQHRF